MTKLFMPILSARNYRTGKYLLCKDGNMHGMINRYLHELSGNTLAIPERDMVDDWQDFKQLLRYLDVTPKLKSYVYSNNIAATRANFVGINGKGKHAEYVVSGIPGTICDEYIANTSKQAGIKQPCDNYLSQDIFSMTSAQQVHVLNEGQIALLPDFIKAKTVCDPDKIANKAFYAKLPIPDMPLADGTLLVPYNLNNKEYAGCEWLQANWKGEVVYTNPRSAKAKSSLTKLEFYGLLQAAKFVQLPANSNIMHVLTKELELFGYELIDTNNCLYTKFGQHCCYYA